MRNGPPYISAFHVHPPSGTEVPSGPFVIESESALGYHSTDVASGAQMYLKGPQWHLSAQTQTAYAWCIFSTFPMQNRH